MSHEVNQRWSIEQGRYVHMYLHRAADLESSETEPPAGQANALHVSSAIIGVCVS